MEVETKTKKRKRSEHSKKESTATNTSEAKNEANNKPNFTQRTVLVLSQKSEAEIFAQDTILGANLSHPLTKDVLGACWEGVLTYCRFVNDLSPQSLFSVFAVGNAVTRLNQWDKDNQLIDVINRVSQLKTVAKANILKGLEAAVKSLGEQINEDGMEDGEDDGKNVNNNKSRIVCVFQDQSNVMMEYSFTRYVPQQGGPTYDLIKSTQSFIENTNEEMTKGYARGKLIENCDIIFISVLSDSIKVVPAGKIYQISSTITVETHFATASNLQNAFTDLSISHFNLGSLSISSISQDNKGKQPQINQIELLYSQSNTIHALSPPVAHFSTTSTLGCQNWRSQTTLCKVVVDKGTLCDNLATCSVHRIAILNSNSKNMQFLQSFDEGKSVLLMMSGPNSSNRPTMFLKLHGNEIFLHKLYEDRLCLDSVPNFFSQNNSKIKLEDYKVEEFNNLMNQSMFMYSDRKYAKRARASLVVESSIKNGESIDYMSTKKLIADTESFSVEKMGPILFTSTQTEELKTMLNQIMTLFRKPILEKSTFHLIFQHLTRISQDISANSYTLIHEKVQEKRKNQYNSLWNEIYRFIDCHKNTSSKHFKFFQCLDSIYIAPKGDANQGMNVENEKEKDDPEMYRYTPKYKYAVPTEARTGNEEKEKHYADKTHKETFTPSILDKNKNSLQHLYWNKFNEAHTEAPFSGYPK
jgi:hypothetical protein